MRYDDKETTKLTSEIIHELLKEFANKYRKYGKNQHAELIIVGGASILLNYGFRDSTIDIDAVINTASSAKDIILDISQKHGIQDDWLNDDFKYTKSFSKQLSLISDHYCYYNNKELEIRTVKAEYLIAMKMMSYREFSRDVSDIAGIMIAETEANNHIDFEKITKAITTLYSKNNDMEQNIIDTVRNMCNYDITSLKEFYNNRLKVEDKIKETTISYIKDENINKENAKQIAHKVYEKIHKTSQKNNKQPRELPNGEIYKPLDNSHEEHSGRGQTAEEAFNNINEQYEQLYSADDALPKKPGE